MVHHIELRMNDRPPSNSNLDSDLDSDLSSDPKDPLNPDPDNENGPRQDAEMLAAINLLHDLLQFEPNDEPSENLLDPNNDKPINEPIINYPDSKLSLHFVRLLKEVTLDNDFISDDLHEQLKNPPQEPQDIAEHPDVLMSIKIFIAVSSRNKYDAIRDAMLAHPTPINMPSFDAVKKIIRNLTEVTSISQNMCINSCLAFVGLFEVCDHCPRCGEAHYDPIRLEQSNGKIKSPHQQFHIIPIGPVIQAFWQSVEVATALRYRSLKTLEIFDELERTGAQYLGTLDDILCSEAYIDAFQESKLQITDSVLMFSIDGAQLYAHKASDIWICI